ncbi:regulatory protein, luxR family [Flaviramulus basaltis]|uniref:Regulatory protein, luxR family n=1 Tax=Flaviramulus basaltis TaxID=369401 RepID=A0A1K2IN02_9FLAO|nr:helix-turn-helix transcriptional regulator [Flaviramulus basaltis]SFZ93678.1 regulatory protein, luxR family [Flaviramulus basaltis]
MKKQTGIEYFLNQLSEGKANLDTMDAKSIKKKLMLFPNQAVSIYDYTTFELKYVDGFEIFGLVNEEISMLDVFNTAIPEQREICGELSGKIIKHIQEHAENLEIHVLNINYAGQHTNGTLMHILLQGKMFETTNNGTIKSILVAMTYLPHLKPPKIVSWCLNEPNFRNTISDLLDKDIMNPNHIRSRELEILQFTAQGHTMSQISKKLHISNRTVEKHLENLRCRFECQNSAQLITFAMDMNLF